MAKIALAIPRSIEHHAAQSLLPTSHRSWEAEHIVGIAHCFAGEIVPGEISSMSQEQSGAIIRGSGYRSSSATRLPNA